MFIVGLFQALVQIGNFRWRVEASWKDVLSEEEEDHVDEWCSIISDQETAKKFLESESSALPSLLAQCSYENKSTQFLTEADWPQDLGFPIGAAALLARPLYPGSCPCGPPWPLHLERKA